MSESVEFTYLQLHSHYSPFGGLVEPGELAEAVLAAGGELPVAAAITDTFCLAAVPAWQQYLAGSNCLPLAGMEAGLSFEGPRGLPFSLLLLAETPQGYANLCYLASLALQRAGQSPLSARLEPEELAAYKTGLIAISPYYGGPVMSALRSGKQQDARNRATILRDIFGPDGFYLGISPLVSSGQPGTVESDNPLVKLNAALVKLARDLKTGLVGTGEARYTVPDEATSYNALRGRMSRAVSSQYLPSTLQRAQTDWLFAPHPVRPNTPLHLRSAAELVAYYSPNDWPGALVNNRLIAERCRSWQPIFKDNQLLLEERCEEALANLPPEQQSGLRERLERELAEIAENGGASSLLAAARLKNRSRYELFIASDLENSLVGFLLDLTYTLSANEETGLNFEPGAPVRLSTGMLARKRLLGLDNEHLHPMAQVLGLDNEQLGPPTLSFFMPLAMLNSEAGQTPVSHPRLTLVSLHKDTLDQFAPFQPADSGEDAPVLAILGGPTLPPGTGLVEISPSRAVTFLDLTLQFLNRWLVKQGKPMLRPTDLPLPEKGLSGRQALAHQLDYLKQNWPVAYYGAALTLAHPDKRAQVAEAIRQARINLVPPTIEYAGETTTCLIEIENTLRVGLDLLLAPPEAAALARAFEGNPSGEITLEELAVLGLSQADFERLAWCGALAQFAPQSNLAAAAGEIVRFGELQRDYLNSTQSRLEADEEQPKAGSAQLSLFDLLGDSASEEIEAEPPVLELPKTEPAPRLVQLEKQREALGFYTSDHPLWSLLPPLDDAAPDDPVELQALLSGDAGIARPVAGLIIGLRRMPLTNSDGKGEELVVVRLEDWSGQAELLVPPGTLLGGALLAEGEAISALAVKINPANAGQGALLVARALDSYPPTAGFTVHLADPGVAATAEQDEPPLDESPLPDESSAPGAPPEEGWASSLFDQLEAIPVVTPPPATAPAAATPAKGGGNKKKTAPPPKPGRRSIHITLPRTDDPDLDTQLMLDLKAVLERFPGEDELHIYLPKEGGGYKHFQPMTLSVSFNQALAHEIEMLAGPNSLRVEEP